MTQRITVVSGIGEHTEVVLAEQGFKTVADLANANVNQLAAVKGFGKARADRAIAAAAALLQSAGEKVAEPEGEEPGGDKDTNEGKVKKSKKKEKKGKKKNKKKEKKGNKKSKKNKKKKK